MVIVFFKCTINKVVLLELQLASMLLGEKYSFSFSFIYGLHLKDCQEKYNKTYIFFF